MTISLQAGIVYGPMRSRRFGTSLGINLLPSDQKICNFDCPYCQYGGSGLIKPAVFPSLDEIRSEVGAFLERHKQGSSKIDWITIAGNGEPTLYPLFSKAVDLLISLRDRFLPEVPIGILSNASTCHRFEIRQVLSRLDARFMKLDAGSFEKFQSANRPCKGVGWKEMVEGLRCMENIILQSLFFMGGEGQNVDEAAVRDWIETVRIIQPRSVQIYSLGRPPGDAGILPVASDILHGISKRLRKETGIPSSVFE